MLSIQFPKHSQLGRAGRALAMHGGTPDDALHAVLGVSPADVGKIDEEKGKAAQEREGK